MITDYFDTKGIDYRTAGVDISEGWIGVSCPFCPDGDHGYHLGINLTTHLYTCWRCRAKGHVVKFVMKTERISRESAETALKKFIDSRIRISQKGLADEAVRSIPVHIQRLFLSQISMSTRILEWLDSRGFSPDIYRDYQIGDGGISGQMRHRAVIPVFMYNQLVNVVGRDITGKADIPYFTLPNREAVLPINDCLYNMDNAKDTAIVVEGVTDVWRIGDGAVGIFGKNYSMRQVWLLSHFKRVFVMLDADARDLGEQLAYDLSAVVPDVSHAEISEGDPGDMSQDDVNDLRKRIFGRIT
ncbi:unnamed protein product [marine sediment metagenome]|uniref:Zinc finger CHC2-type domain-containing protein n=1 Tax=marine sediment metagenome TaxID=412755 RepID=X0YFC5_9ZZZZ